MFLEICCSRLLVECSLNHNQIIYPIQWRISVLFLAGNIRRFVTKKICEFFFCSKTLFACYKRRIKTWYRNLCQYSKANNMKAKSRFLGNESSISVRHAILTVLSENCSSAFFAQNWRGGLNQYIFLYWSPPRTKPVQFL